MELTKSSDFEKIVGQIQSTNFAIDESAQAIIMDSLINLYSDPIGSIVREATSNCIDAYRERELKKQGKIPLEGEDDLKWFSDKHTIELAFTPKNSLLGVEGTFIFKDWGVGLSEQRVKDIYTRFGNSTKRVNNYQIGGFGIGAKAPFSYADTFYVKTRYNGIEYTYMLYKGEAVPSMDLVSKKETKEKNGTHIIVPLNEYNDTSKFRDAINRQLKYFDNIVYNGVEEHCGSLSEAEIVYNNNDVLIDTSGSTAGILVGNVQYPIDWRLIEISELYCGAYFKFNIGEIDLVPSRESIRYTEKTKLLIKDKIRTVRNIFTKEIQEELEAETDMVAYLRKVSEIKRMSDGNYYGRTGKSLIGKKAYISGKNALSKLGYKDYKLRDLKFSDLMEWFEFQRVGRASDSRYVGGYKITFSKIDQWSTLFNDTNPDEPFYYVEETYSRKKDFYILNQFPEERSKNFIRFKIREHLGDRGSTYPKDEKFIKEFIECPCIKSYLNLDMADDVIQDEDIGLFESEKDRRKREEKVFFKKLICSDKSWANDISDRVGFTGKESDFGNIEDDEATIIYGFSEDDALLKRVGGIVLSRAGRHGGTGNHRKLIDDDKIKVYKIAANVEKYFTKHIYIKDFFMEKHPLLKEYYTACQLQEFRKGWEYLKAFKRYNEDIFNIYEEVTKFMDNHDSQESGLELTNEFKDEILSLCSESSLVLQELIDKRDVLEEYSKGLDLLLFIPDLQKIAQDQKLVRQVREYLKFKNKTIVEPEGATRAEVKDKVYDYYKKFFVNIGNWSYLESAKENKFKIAPRYKEWIKANPIGGHTSYDEVPNEGARRDWKEIKKSWFNDWYDKIDTKFLENLFDEQFNIYLTFKIEKDEVLYSL